MITKFKLTEFLRCDNSYSAMRLGFIICVITGCLSGITLGILDILYNQGKNLLGVAAIVGSLLTPAYYGKQKQAQSELKNKSEEETK